MHDNTRIHGWGIAEVFGPAGELKQRVPFVNLITNVGDQMYGERGASISGAPGAPTGMKLGSSSTAAAKSGAGSYLGTYLSGSNQAFDATYPQSSKPSTARRITYKVTWAAGDVTASNIRECVIVNDTIGDDSTSAESETISRVVFGADINKGANDTLAVTWHHDLEAS